MTTSLDKRVFKLTNFRPVGFREMNYPVNLCPICRGPLTEVCMDCSEKKKNECVVELIDDVYYHKDCQKLIQANDSVGKKK